jgi:GNAT superfamily N-acetyltransferase
MPAVTQHKWIIRTGFQPGDIGDITRLHGMVYACEYGFGPEFEAYVAAGIAEFVETFNPDYSRIWLAEKDGKIIGCIAVFGRSDSVAQLRWFITHPDFRGIGLGHQLLSEALRFCNGCGYKTIYLWTIDNLEAAIHLYQSSGFKKTGDTIQHNWTKPVVQQKYELVKAI